MLRGTDGAWVARKTCVCHFVAVATVACPYVITNNNNNITTRRVLLARQLIVPLTRTVYATLRQWVIKIIIINVILYYYWCCHIYIRVGCHKMITFYFFIEPTFYSQCYHQPCVSIKPGSQLSTSAVVSCGF